MGIVVDFTHYDPAVVLAISAHPDDIDLGIPCCGASGSIAAWTAAGVVVHYLVVTDGGKGTADRTTTRERLVQIREQEQREAAATLGVANVQFLHYEDGTLELTMDLKKDIVRVIRQLRPDTVVVFDPVMVYSSEQGFVNHPDHRAVGQATLDAVFPLARDYLSFPELYTQEKLEPHKVKHLLLMNCDKQNYFVDVTNSFDAKIAAVMKHKSQVGDGKAAIEALKQRAAAAGGKAGHQYAEGFVRIDIPE